ncbi:MAG: helix-turn-helix transcriptional regulator [Henriciella sp.]|nr:helix-turn-helix transcriptional regulator [Henriciella sp.]
MTNKNPSNHLKAWREFRGFTQESLASSVGTTAAVVSLLENGQRGLSASWLDRLSRPLQTSPGFLLDRHPSDLATELLELWAGIPTENQPKAIKALRSLSIDKTGT